MKKLYYLFLTMLLSIVGMGANADNVDVVINVDDATRVGIQLYSNDTYTYVDQDVVDGENKYSVQQYGQYRIYAKSGNLLAKIKDNSYGYDVLYQYGTEYSGYASSAVSLTVTSAKESDVYTKSFKITVDDPSKVTAQLYSGRRLSLNEGENTVSYSPETEPQVSVSTYGTPLYKVTDGGVDVAPQGSMYYITLGDNTDINVISAWPEDVKFNLDFQFADENTKDAISGIAVDGVPVENFSTDGVEIKGGAQVTVNFNIEQFSINSFTVNGSTTSVYGSQYSFYITENTTLGVSATKLVPISFTVNIDDPSNITLYKGYTYENNTVALVAGDNQLEMSSNSSRCITIVANDQCYVSSINDGTQDYTISASGTTVYIAEGMTVTIKTGKIVRDKTAKVIVTGRDLAESYFSFYSNSNSSLRYDFVEGENNLAFCDADLPFNFGCHGSTISSESKIFVNGLRAHRYYGQYSLNFDDGATVRIDLNNSYDEKEKTVQFVLGEGITNYMVASVETPLGTAYEWQTLGVSSIEDNTYDVTITPAAEAALAVVVDDNTVEAKDGKFVVTVTPETKTISIVDPSTTGIREISNTDNAGENKIYTIGGVLVKKATKGIYIVNGRKYIAK